MDKKYIKDVKRGFFRLIGVILFLLFIGLIIYGIFWLIAQNFYISLKIFIWLILVAVIIFIVKKFLNLLSRWGEKEEDMPHTTNKYSCPKNKRKRG